MPERVAWPPWDEKVPPGFKHIRGPVHSGPQRNMVEAWKRVRDDWDAAPGLNDKTMGHGYLYYTDPVDGSVLQWQVPVEAMEDLDIFRGWLRSQGLDWEQPDWGLYTKSFVRDPESETP